MAGEEGIHICGLSPPSLLTAHLLLLLKTPHHHPILLMLKMVRSEGVFILTQVVIFIDCIIIGSNKRALFVSFLPLQHLFGTASLGIHDIAIAAVHISIFCHIAGISPAPLQHLFPQGPSLRPSEATDSQVCFIQSSCICPSHIVVSFPLVLFANCTTRARRRNSIFFNRLLK